MKEIYLNYLTKNKDAKKLAYDVLEEKTNISRSKLHRIFTGQLDVTVADLEVIVEKGFGESTDELYAQMGRQEFRDSKDFDYKGAKELLSDFNAEKAQIREEYEKRIAQSIEAREEAQLSFNLALAQIGDQYRRNADYLTGIINDNEAYIRDLLAKTEQANTIATAAQKHAEEAEDRAKIADGRADSAELENRTTRKKMYMLFSGMLFLLVFVVILFALGIVLDLPLLGMGNG